MKQLKFALPLLVLLAVGFMLAGCPKDKMMGDAARPTVEHVG